MAKVHYCLSHRQFLGEWNFLMCIFNRPKALICALIFFANLNFVYAADITNSRLTLQGLEPLKIGMTSAQVAKSGYLFTTPEYENINECAQVNLIGQEGIGLMFEEDRLTRIEIYNTKILSLSGIRVGDSEEKVIRTYGPKLIIEPHFYEEQGHYLKVLSNDKNSAMVFETNGKVVTQMRAGSSAEYVEGCL